MRILREPPAHRFDQQRTAQRSFWTFPTTASRRAHWFPGPGRMSGCGTSYAPNADIDRPTVLIGQICDRCARRAEHRC